MTSEKLIFANMLKEKINKLDREINLLLELTPPIRDKMNRKGVRGWIQKIRERSIVYKRPSLKEIEIEMSNEDCRALIDIRAAERNALKQVLDELG